MAQNWQATDEKKTDAGDSLDVVNLLTFMEESHDSSMEVSHDSSTEESHDSSHLAPIRGHNKTSSKPVFFYFPRGFDPIQYLIFFP
jgi:hypothetical protein